MSQAALTFTISVKTNIISWVTTVILMATGEPLGACLSFFDVP